MIGIAGPAAVEAELAAVPAPAQRAAKPATGIRGVGVSRAVAPEMLKLTHPARLNADRGAGHDGVLRKLLLRQNDLDPRQTNRVAAVGFAGVGAGLERNRSHRP